MGITGIHLTLRLEPTEDERFWNKVEKTDTCWLWIAARSNGTYGAYWNSEKQVTERAHRVSYRMEYGDIPEGLTLDHLCRVPLCVRPSHLEAVDRLENLARERRRQERIGPVKCPECETIYPIQWTMKMHLAQAH